MRLLWQGGPSKESSESSPSPCLPPRGALHPTAAPVTSLSWLQVPSPPQQPPAELKTGMQEGEWWNSRHRQTAVGRRELPHLSAPCLTTSSGKADRLVQNPQQPVSSLCCLQFTRFILPTSPTTAQPASSQHLQRQGWEPRARLFGRRLYVLLPTYAFSIHV